jgi:hypothetical protein
MRASALPDLIASRLCLPIAAMIFVDVKPIDDYRIFRCTLYYETYPSANQQMAYGITRTFAACQGIMLGVFNVGYDLQCGQI